MLQCETMRAMVLAAGLGTRMRPLTDQCPKPLITVGGQALIDYAFDTLCEAGVPQAVVNTHYLAAQMRTHFQMVKKIPIDESHERERLETGGGIKHALPLLGKKPFFVLNSDTICLSAPGKPVLREMASAYDAAQMDMMLLLMPTAHAIGYHGPGDFILNEDATRFRRRRADEQGELVFTGLQLLHPQLFAHSPDGPFSMNILYNQRQTAEGWFERIGFMIHEGEWLHVGDMDGLAAANRFFGARVLLAH